MSAISDVTASNVAYQNTAVTKTADTKSSDVKKTDSKSSKGKDTKTDVAAVYEKSEGASGKKATYTINKMSESDRAAIVNQMKADQEQRMSQLTQMVSQMINGQGKAYSLATGDDSIWKFLAKGDFTVDPATKAQAQEDISEDGYWGVKQTSQRLFDFAQALAGDDEGKMKKMQAAIEKGYNQATKAWGQDLPDISKQTLDATNKLFDDYYASKKTAE